MYCTCTPPDRHFASSLPPQTSHSARAGSTPAGRIVSPADLPPSVTHRHSGSSSLGDSKGGLSKGSSGSFGSSSSSSHNVSSSSSSGMHSSGGLPSSSSGSGGASFGRSFSSEGLSGGSGEGDGDGRRGEESQGDGGGEDLQEKGEGRGGQREEKGLVEAAEETVGEGVRKGQPSLSVDFEVEPSVSLLSNHLGSVQSSSDAKEGSPPSETSQVEENLSDTNPVTTMAGNEPVHFVQAMAHIDTIEESLPMSAAVQPIHSEPETPKAAPCHPQLLVGSACLRNSLTLSSEEEPTMNAPTAEGEMEADDSAESSVLPDQLEGERDSAEIDDRLSPEVTLQAVTVAKTPDKSGVSSTIDLPPERSKDESAAAKIDLAELTEVEYSTQSSFALRLSQSQSSATPMSPFKIGPQHRTERNASPMKCLREIEEHEKEFVNLRERTGYIQDAAPCDAPEPQEKTDSLCDGGEEHPMEVGGGEQETGASLADGVASCEGVSRPVPVAGGNRGTTDEGVSVDSKSAESKISSQDDRQPGRGLSPSGGVAVIESKGSSNNGHSDSNQASAATDVRPSIVIATVISSSQGPLALNPRADPALKGPLTGHQGLGTPGVQVPGGMGVLGPGGTGVQVPGGSGISVSTGGDIAGSEVREGESAEYSLEQLTG